MSAAAATERPKAVRAALRESAPVTGRVDRERGIVFSVKIVGRTSPNTHGVRGASGTEYTLAALRAALPLYEGVKVNVDHPPRSAAGQERSARDRFAWLEECYVNAEGIYGDLHFLDPTDPLAVRVMNAAERKPDAYALSHNALGKGAVSNGKYVVAEVPEVRSVDLVADGGTNRSLFEGAEPVMTTARQLIDGAAAGKYPRLRKLLEMYEDEGSTEMVAPGAGEEEPGELDHLFNAFKACMKNDPEKAKKILALLKPEAADAAEVEEGEDEDAAAEEGRRPRAAKPGEVVLTEARARAMCKAAGVEATADVLEAVAGAGFDQALAVINLAKRAAAPARAGSAPRSVSRGAPEAAAPAAADAKGWAARLLG